MSPDEDDDESGDQLQPDLPDAADPAQTRKRQTKKALYAEQERLWWSQAMGHEVGRRCLWQVLVACKTFDEPFGITQTGFPHEQATWFIAGKQKVGLDLYHTWLRMDPTAVSAMHRENDARFFRTKDIK